MKNVANLALCMCLFVTMILGIGQNVAAVKLTYWNNHGTEFPEYLEWLEEIANTEFVKMHPEVEKVEVVVIPYEGYLAKYLSAFMAKRGAPDMFNAMAPQWGGMFDFADPMPKDLAEKIEETVLPHARKIGTVEGTRYGVPWPGGMVFYLFANVDLFREAGLDPENPPRNFDELLEYAKKLTVYDPDGKIKRQGLGLRYKGHPVGITDKFAPFLHGMGGRLVAPDYSTATGYADSPESLKAFTYHTDLVTKWKVSSLELGSPADTFSKGLAGMIFRESWFAGFLDTHTPDLNYRIYPPPQDANSVGPTVYTMYPWTDMVYSESPNKDLAWDFWRWYWAQEHDLQGHRLAASFPVMKANFESDYATSQPYYETLKEILLDEPYAPDYYHPAMNKIAIDFGESVLDALYGKMDPEVALRMGTAKINLLLEKN